MKGRISLKTIISLVVILLVGVLGILGVNTVRTFMSGAATGVEPKNVIATPGDDGRSAAVVWNSDKASMGIVEYGTAPASLLLRSIEGEATSSHNVALSSLKPNANYYFRIRVGEEIFDNNGIPFSFKTKAATNGGEEEQSEQVPVQQPSPEVSVDGGCNRTTDYNGDGVINSIDYVNCLSKKGNSSPQSGGEGSNSASCSNVDFDKNGVINSIDKIKCLQNSQR